MASQFASTGGDEESVHTPLKWVGGNTKAMVWVPSSRVSEEDQRWFASKPPAWHAVLFWVVNIFFAVGGAVIAGVGINLATETSGAIFGLLPGTLAACLGLSVVALALFGVLGERCQIKLMLLVYFLLVVDLILAQLAALLALAIRWGTFDPIFSTYWGDYDEAKREEGQVAYDCCGYNDRYDRPAGNCSATVPSCCDGCGACEGCKIHALNKLYAQAVPLLIAIPIFVVAQIVGVALVGFILCRRTKSGNQMSAAQAKQFKTEQLQSKGVSVVVLSGSVERHVGRDQSIRGAATAVTAGSAPPPLMPAEGQFPRYWTYRGVNTYGRSAGLGVYSAPNFSSERTGASIEHVGEVQEAIVVERVGVDDFGEVNRTVDGAEITWLKLWVHPNDVLNVDRSGGWVPDYMESGEKSMELVREYDGCSGIRCPTDGTDAEMGANPTFIDLSRAGSGGQRNAAKGLPRTPLGRVRTGESTEI